MTQGFNGLPSHVTSVETIGVFSFSTINTGLFNSSPTLAQRSKSHVCSFAAGSQDGNRCRSVRAVDHPSNSRHHEHEHQQQRIHRWRCCPSRSRRQSPQPGKARRPRWPRRRWQPQRRRGHDCCRNREPSGALSEPQCATSTYTSGSAARAWPGLSCGRASSGACCYRGSNAGGCMRVVRVVHAEAACGGAGRRPRGGADSGCRPTTACHLQGGNAATAGCRRDGTDARCGLGAGAAFDPRTLPRPPAR
jgi:hypothetical protein